MLPVASRSLRRAEAVPPGAESFDMILSVLTPTFESLSSPLMERSFKSVDELISRVNQFIRRVCESGQKELWIVPTHIPVIGHASLKPVERAFPGSFLDRRCLVFPRRVIPHEFHEGLCAASISLVEPPTPVDCLKQSQVGLDPTHVKVEALGPSDPFVERWDV